MMLVVGLIAMKDSLIAVPSMLGRQHQMDKTDIFGAGAQPVQAEIIPQLELLLTNQNGQEIS